MRLAPRPPARLPLHPGAAPPSPQLCNLIKLLTTERGGGGCLGNLCHCRRNTPLLWAAWCPDPFAGVLTPDVMGLPGAEYSLNAVMKVRLEPLQGRRDTTVCRVPWRAGSVCSQGEGPPQKLFAGALAMSVQPLKSKNIKRALFQPLSPGCRISTASTQHPGLVEGLALLFSEASPPPPISVFFSGPSSLLTNPKPSSQPTLVL